MSKESMLTDFKMNKHVKDVFQVLSVPSLLVLSKRKQTRGVWKDAKPRACLARRNLPHCLLPGWTVATAAQVSTREPHTERDVH